jgi:hypothetical protein
MKNQTAAIMVRCSHCQNWRKIFKRAGSCHQWTPSGIIHTSKSSSLLIAYIMTYSGSWCAKFKAKEVKRGE